MVALHPVPLDDRPVDAAIDDDDLVVALGEDARLDPVAARAVETAATRDPADAVFADIEVGGRRRLRPGWSPTRLLAEPTAASPLAVRARWLRAHGVRPGDPALPLHLARAGACVLHVPTVLTRHDTPPPGPGPDELDHHLRTIGVPARVARGVAPAPLVADPDFAPAVSVVVPTAGASVEIDGHSETAISRLLDSLGERPERIEVLVVVGDEFRGDPTALARRATLVRRPPGGFNFSAATNLGVLHARHPHVLLLNDDTEAPGWHFVDAMALHLCDPTVAAVGARLRYPDGTLQHAGMVIDDARPLHSFVGWDPAATAAHGGDIAHEVIAATGAALMVRRHDYLAVGGLSVGFPLSFNDVDLCIRLGRTVGRIIVEPAATLVHHETLTRAAETTPQEWDRWISRWSEIVDPWYHPGHHRPDDPHHLHRNADHLAPDPPIPPSTAVPRDTRLRSRVHRGRPAAGAG